MNSLLASAQNTRERVVINKLTLAGPSARVQGTVTNRKDHRCGTSLRCCQTGIVSSSQTRIVTRSRTSRASCPTTPTTACCGWTSRARYRSRWTTASIPRASTSTSRSPTSPGKTLARPRTCARWRCWPRSSTGQWRSARPCSSSRSSECHDAVLAHHLRRGEQHGPGVRRRARDRPRPQGRDHRRDTGTAAGRHDRRQHARGRAMSAPHASDFEVRVRNTAHGQPRPYAAHTYIDEIVIVTYKQFGHARHSQAMVLQMAKGVCGGYVEEEQGDWDSMRLVGLTK